MIHSEKFETLLLEFLSEFQISIPELSAFKARHTPYPCMKECDGLTRFSPIIYID